MLNDTERHEARMTLLNFIRDDIKKHESANAYLSGLKGAVANLTPDLNVNIDGGIRSSLDIILGAGATIERNQKNIDRLKAQEKLVIDEWDHQDLVAERTPPFSVKISEEMD